MSFLELAKKRYTAKKYDPTKKISQEKIEELAEILRLSPSSINSQPWSFIFVSDEKLKKELAKASFFNEEKILEANCLVVFNAIDNLQKFEERIIEYLPDLAVGYYQQVLKPQSEEKVRTWISQQVYISLGVFLSACADMGIDSTAMEGIDREQYQQILEMKDYKPLFAVAIGYRDENDGNQPSVNPKQRLPKTEIVKFI